MAAMLAERYSRFKDVEVESAECRLTGEEVLVGGGAIHHHGRRTGSSPRRGPGGGSCPTLERIFLLRDGCL